MEEDEWYTLRGRVAARTVLGEEHLPLTERPMLPFSLHGVYNVEMLPFMQTVGSLYLQQVMSNIILKIIYLQAEGQTTNRDRLPEYVPL